MLLSSRLPDTRARPAPIAQRMAIRAAAQLPGQKEVRHIRTRDQQDECYGADQDQQCGPHVPDLKVLKRSCRDTLVFVHECGVLCAEALAHYLELGFGLLDRHPAFGRPVTKR